MILRTGTSRTPDPLADASTWDSGGASARSAAPQLADPLIGRKLGSYLLRARIGSGGMGAVYLGSHDLLDVPAAVKVLKPSISTEGSHDSRFFMEAKTIGKLRDPGVVSIYDFGRASGMLYIIMELLQGESLSQRLQREGKLSPKQAINITTDVAETLRVAHDRGIVHRDVKPGNIFIVPNRHSATGERTKLLDFGIAKLSTNCTGDRLTAADSILGTPHYMAPEQFMRAGNVDARADIYSLGCVLYCMLTGELPFKGASYGELCAAHMMEVPARPSAKSPVIPTALDEIVLKCLKKNEADRFSSMGQLVHRLHTAASRLEARVPASPTHTPKNSPISAAAIKHICTTARRANGRIRSLSLSRIVEYCTGYARAW